jgi:hypothetical protein
VCLRIDGNRVRMGHFERTDQLEFPVAALKDGDGARFRGDIQPFETWIEGEHIRIISHLIGREDLHCVEIYHGDRMISFTGDECEAATNIEHDSMRILNSGQRILTYYFVGRRIDSDEQVHSMNCYQYVSRPRIVDGVSSPAAERNLVIRVLLVASMTASTPPCSSETKTFFSLGAYARPSG